MPPLLPAVIPTAEQVAVRVHDACLTSECFFSTKCDCREQLAQAVQHVAQLGGIVIYLFQVSSLRTPHSLKDVTRQFLSLLVTVLGRKEEALVLLPKFAHILCRLWRSAILLKVRPLAFMG
jgi:hypothetical protein